MDLGTATHSGYVRNNNEDGFFAARELGVFAVADGMGGHEHGEIASHLALDTVAQHAEMLSHASPNELTNLLYTVIQTANAAIYTQAETQNARLRMGTTLVVATICADRLYFAHIGDSRLYLLRGDVFTQLTRDHSLVQSLIDRGEISAEEAAIHPLRHQITRVVGGEDRVTPEIASQALEPGDAILLCTDGLSGIVSTETMRTILSTDQTAQQKADMFVQTALAAGGPDNITTVVVCYQCPRTVSAETTQRYRRGKHRPRVFLSIILPIILLLLLAAGIVGWLYTHPSYTVAENAQQQLTLYKCWPSLPFLQRQRILTPDIPAISITEARPYLSQYAEKYDKKTGINGLYRESGITLMNEIVSNTASGLLQQASIHVKQHDIAGARRELQRAKELHGDPVMIKQLEDQIALIKPSAPLPQPPANR